jgi:excisionase family DNA binding protein
LQTAKELLDISDVSEYLGIKVSTLYSWTESAILPHYRLGRLVKFMKSDIDEWLEKCKRDPVDVHKKAIKILKSVSKPRMDIDTLRRKTIAEVKSKQYIPNHGKPDRIKGLRKEVEDGSI